MLIEELFALMLDAYRNYGVNVVALWENDDKIEEIDLGFRKKMASNFDYRPAVSQIEEHLKFGGVYLYEDDLGLNYSFIRFPERFSQPLRCRFLSLGPFLIHPMDSDTFEAFMEEKEIEPAYRQDFLEYYNRLPLVHSLDSWNHMLGFFLERLCGEPPEFLYAGLTEEYRAYFEPPRTDYSSPSQPDIALKAISSRYVLENKFMKAVSEGNAAEGYRAYHQFQQYRLLPRVADPVRNQKNLLFTFNTLLRKAAEMGHVHPLHIDALSRQIAIQIESCLSLKQLERLHSSMIRKYCLLVNNYTRRPYSALIQKCLDYIDFHYNMELSLDALARMFSVSESHLSSLFKKETGTTVTGYINSTRIRQALRLLNTSSLPIGEVAFRCGFLDSNYFSRIFKKELGISPRKYRDSIRKRA